MDYCDYEILMKLINAFINRLQSIIIKSLNGSLCIFIKILKLGGLTFEISEIKTINSLRRVIITQQEPQILEL